MSALTPNCIAIDVETTMLGNEDIGLSHPMYGPNYVVLFGSTNVLGDSIVTDDPTTFHKIIASHTNTLICGHNISFDLMYLYRYGSLKHTLQNYKLWDTQLAEYILSGQRTKFSSLDELSIKYGCPVKDDKITAYFKAGIGSDKIPREELEPYLHRDLKNTWSIAIKQYEIAERQGQLALIQSQMQALHGTTEMMYNGLHIDKKRLDAYTVEVVDSFVDVKLNLEELVVGLVEDINSPKQWSQFFFGGTKRVKVKEEVGVYKNGNTKYKLVEKSVAIKPAIAYVPDPDKVSAKTKQVSVDESVLNDMLNHTFKPDIVAIIKALMKYRELSKQLSTYVQGLSKHVIHDFIYGKLNHTATVTGRLSSTNPNLQNISNNPIKQIFDSRYDNGLIVEVDFNQLEVVALAHVTRDKQLIADISGGADIHSELYKDMFGKYPTKEERKPFKSRTFQLIYGAGAKAISKQAGCSIEEAKKFIDVFYTRYPDVARWHEEFAHDIELSSKHLTDSTGLMEKFKTCVWVTETGRKFTFAEYYSESTWSPKMYNFSPTEMKNYPIQGLATGDIVPMMVGVIFEKLKGREGIKMVNTIHDSLMFDVRADLAADFILEVTDILKDTDKYFLETFKTPLALKLNAGASLGTNWFNMEEVSL
jgi:DNA polymerase I-like protein with 3'-5' exonuclease and polymerase domains